MSTQPQSSDGELSDEEQDLLDIAASELESATYARNILRVKYGYEEEELP